jgi:DNA replication protein DnaC
MTQTGKAAPGKLIFDRKRLTEGVVQAPKAPMCQLAAKRDCCGGKGYSLTTRGASAHAALCKCVTECPACFGRARIFEGNTSRECQTPPPNVVANLINAANIPARYADANLDKFTNYSGNAREILREIGKWKAKFQPTRAHGLILSGPVGVGKTYILTAIAKDLAERGFSVRFTDFFQLLGELRAGFSEGKADRQQLAPLIDVDVLIIDELGKGRNNDFEMTVLDQLVCGRYNQNKSIIASTNYLLRGKTSGYFHNFNRDLDTERGGGGTNEFTSDRFESLEARVGGRIYSRLREMTNFLELTGDDFRRRDA